VGGVTDAVLIGSVVLLGTAVVVAFLAPGREASEEDDAEPQVTIGVPDAAV